METRFTSHQFQQWDGETDFLFLWGMCMLYVHTHSHNWTESWPELPHTFSVLSDL